MTALNAATPAPAGDMLYQLQNVVKTRTAGDSSFSLRVPNLQIHQGEKIVKLIQLCYISLHNQLGKKSYGKNYQYSY